MVDRVKGLLRIGFSFAANRVLENGGHGVLSGWVGFRIKKNFHLQTLNLNTSYYNMPQTEIVDFTTNDARPVICQRCRESFENGYELYYMRASKPDGPGKHVCAGCRQYYLRKTAQNTSGIVLST